MALDCPVAEMMRLADPWGENLPPKAVYEAACKFGEKVVRAPRPSRHHTILQIADQFGYRHPEEQGFVLKDGTFVDRIEAARLAVEHGQILTLHAPPRLYSEDLW